ncbi:5'-nucleotidase C-terminal domain-containing protein [Saccharicrinis carchari]|nr:5'-nucleotidase [Saccharicrinis carchari]
MNLTKLTLTILLPILYLGCAQPYKAKNYEVNNISIDDNITADSAMQSHIKPYRKEIDAKMDKAIGKSEKQMLVYKPESPLSNFISDIIQNRVDQYLRDTHADTLQLLTLMNIKGIRSPIPQGEVTVRNIFELMPFENEIVVLTLPGDSILSLFSFLGRTKGDGIAGATVKFQDSTVVEVFINNKALDVSKKYMLATSDYLADGGDHYQMITRPLHRENTNLKLREVIMHSIQEKNRAGEVLKAATDGRIVFN